MVVLRSGTMTDPNIIPSDPTITTTVQVSSFDHVVVKLMEIQKDSDIYKCFWSKIDSQTRLHY
jgi:hypothetical protein